MLESKSTANLQNYELECPSATYNTNGSAAITNKGYDKEDPIDGSHVTCDVAMETTKCNDRDTLQRTLGYRQAFVLMIGLILGSGVFVSPSLVAKV